MKKILLFATLLATVCTMTSCIKGSDLEMLKHPVHVVGSIDPTFGIPVAYGGLDMNDILSRLGTDYEGRVDEDSTTITITYEAKFDSTIVVNPNKKKTPRRNIAPSRTRKDDYTWVPFQMTQKKAISIDFFKRVSELGDIDFDAIWLDLTTFAQADFSDATMAEYVQVSFDSIVLTYVPMGATVPQMKTIDDTIKLINLKEGETKKFKRINLADVVNSAPTTLEVAFRLNFNMRSDYISTLIENEGFDFWLDTMGVTTFNYSATMNVIMPLSVGIGGLQYDFDISLGEGIKSIDLDSILNMNVEIDSSILTLSMDNGIPLDITLSAALCDVYGNPFNTLFNNKLVRSAKVRQDPQNPTRYEAIDTTNTIIRVNLDSDQLNELRDNAKTIKLRMIFDSAGKHVNIKKEDMLYMKVYLQVDPKVSMDIEVLHNGIL